MKTVTSFFVYAGLAIGLVVLIPAIFLLINLDWYTSLPVYLLLIVIPIWTMKKKAKKGSEKPNAMADKLRCKECNALIGEKSVKNDERQICPYCGAEDAID